MSSAERVSRAEEIAAEEHYDELVHLMGASQEFTSEDWTGMDPDVFETLDEARFTPAKPVGELRVGHGDVTQHVAVQSAQDPTMPTYACTPTREEYYASLPDDPEEA